MTLCAFYHNLKTKLKIISGPGEEKRYQSQCKGHHETVINLFYVLIPLHNLTALSWQRGWCNSVKLRAVPGRATQDGQEFIYLAELVLSCSTWDFRSIMQDLLFQHAGSLVMISRFSCSVACGILVP